MCLDDFAFRKYVLNVIIVNTKTSVFMTKDQILIRERERERERSFNFTFYYIDYVLSLFTK